MNYAEWTKRARESSAPDPRRVRRVRHRLDRLLSPARSELSSLPSPSPGAAGRVKARLMEGRQRQRSGRWGALFPLLVGGAAFAMAAGGLVIEAPLHLDPQGEVEPTERFLAGAGSAALSPQVHLAHEGAGVVQRRGEDVLIEWELGRLSLRVAPGEAIVEVRTPEGQIRVLDRPEASDFAVDRGPLGTELTVQRGAIELRCAGGEALTVRPGAVQACWPTTAAGLLNRARTLAAEPNTASLLETLERGLALPGEPAVRVELLALQVSALVSAGRHEEALAAAEQALAEGPDAIRASELHRTAARLSLIGGYCDRAASHFDALSSLTPEEQAHRDCCGSERCREELEQR